MASRSLLKQVIGWTALWLFWVVVSRRNHPTLGINVAASFLLTAMFAAGAYANLLWLTPRLLDRGRRFAYAVALSGLLAFLAVICAAAIHIVYDLVWGPDPRRFGFGTNVGMEFVLAVVHVSAIGLAVRGVRRRRSGWSASLGNKMLFL